MGPWGRRVGTWWGRGDVPILVRLGPGRVNNSRLAAGLKLTEVQIMLVNCSCSGKFGNDYAYKRVYLEDIYL